MTPFWQSVACAGLWSAVWVALPVYFATRAVRAGRTYDGDEDGDDTPDRYIYRADDPDRFWRKVKFVYALALLGLAPWVIILFVALTE